MSRIKSKNTQPERILGKLLWSSGVRYRKHNKSIPGKPDFSISKYRIAIFVDGDFWHGLNWEARKKGLKANREYWIPKIERNIERDKEINLLLSTAGWTVVRCWETDIKKHPDQSLLRVMALVEKTN